MLSRPVYLALAALTSCGPGAAPPASPEPPPVYPLYAAPPPSVAPPAIYTADEAIRDALSSPLELVGVGGWTGYYRHLSCIYRNPRVFLVDVRCNERENYQFEAVIYSPTRGRVQMTAEGRDKAVAFSTLSRASYDSFEVSGEGPWPGPPELTLAMSYDDIEAYDELRSRKNPAGGCGLTTKSSQVLCSVRAPFTPAAFGAANGGFFQTPPNEWYLLVRGLAFERPRSYAATDLGRVGIGQLRDWGAAVGFQNDIDVSENVLPFVGQPDQLAAVVATGGGMAFAGTRQGREVVVARTDRAGTKLWESVLAEPGIREENNASLVATQDGFVVHAEGFVDPGRLAHHRLVKIDAHGKVQWKWVPSKRERPGQFFRARLTPEGTVEIDGYVQLEKDGPVHGWTVEVSADGKTLREEIGSVELGQQNSRP